MTVTLSDRRGAEPFRFYSLFSALSLCLLLFATGCIIPLAAPSARIEGGYAMSSNSSSRGTIRAGAHVVGNRTAADATWDLGAGYVGTAGGDERNDGMTPVESTHGGYIEGAYLHRIGEHTRLSIGPGLQVSQRDGDTLVPVAYVRSSVELYSPMHAAGSSSDRCGSATGTWHGQIGLGTYVDVQRPLTDGGITVVAGLTLRMPSFAGVAVVIPGCK